MIRTRLAMLAALVAAGAAALSACGAGTAGTAAPDLSSGNQAIATLAAQVTFTPGKATDHNVPANTGDFFDGPSNNSQAMKWVQLSASSAGDLNPVVVNAKGHVEYRFDPDGTNPPKSNCNGACAVKWPPVLVTKGSRIFLDGISRSAIGLVKRDDGTMQVTINKHAIYLFSGDKNAGDTNGQGIGGTWFGVTPTGEKAGAPSQTGSSGVDYTTGTAKQHNAPQNTGDFYNGPSNSPSARKWVQLTASSSNGLNPIVVNGTGYTMYRFDPDGTNPPKSNCNGACAVKWPPVEVTHGSRIFVNGVPTSEIGFVKRDDGSLQVTVHGHAIYRFSGDKKPGDTNGEGVGGTWFAISPTGDKVLPPAGSTPPAAGATTTENAPTTTTTTTTTAPVLGNGTVTLFDSADPADDTSQQVAGPGCQNVGRPDVASRLALNGGPVKIWTGPDCTGTPKVISQSVPDLSAIGFDNKIESVRFGG
jgi:predicted lipoprotein with Yx(FWY)xxD motif